MSGGRVADAQAALELQRLDEAHSRAPAPGMQDGAVLLHEGLLVHLTSPASG